MMRRLEGRIEQVKKVRRTERCKEGWKDGYNRIKKLELDVYSRIRRLEGRIKHDDKVGRTDRTVWLEGQIEQNNKVGRRIEQD